MKELPDFQGRFKVCFICISLRPGGTERVVSRMANQLSACSDVSIVLLSRADLFYQLSERVSVFRPEVGSRRETGWIWYVRIVAYLWRVLGQLRSAVICCFGEAIAPVILLICRMRGLPVLVFNRASPLSSLRGIRGVVNPLLYPLASGVVLQTRASVSLLRRRYIGSVFHVLPNPVAYPPSVRPILDRARRIITVGTLGGRKNQEHLIRAFAEIPTDSGWLLDIVGDGPDRERLEILSESLSLQGRVRFWGLREDVDALLQGARIFAFPSLTEGFPNALAEALASGCACISYDCPTGPSELIRDGVNGLLVPNGSYDDFRCSLMLLTQSETLQKRFSEAARTAIQEFSEEAVLQSLAELITTTR